MGPAGVAERTTSPSSANTPTSRRMLPSQQIATCDGLALDAHALHCRPAHSTATPRAKARVYIAEGVAMAQKLDIAFWSYDRTRLLADGSVKIEGADVVRSDDTSARIRRLGTGHDLLPSHLRRGGSLTVSGDSRLSRPRVQARCHLHQ